MMKFRESVLARLTEKHDSAAEKLNEFAALQEYEGKVTAAESANDLRQIFELATEMELKCGDIEENSCSDEARPDSGQRIVGDVCGALKDLQLMIDRQMENVLLHCATAELPERSSLLKPVSTISDLEAKPVCIAFCSNTCGFYGDLSGRVVKPADSEMVDSLVELPAVCLIVLFYWDFLNEIFKDHLLAISVDGLRRFKIQREINWQDTCGLHCDSSRQLLFIAHSETVTVVDLIGKVFRVINSDCLGVRIADICAVDGNADKIFVFDNAEKTLLGIGKDKGDLQVSISVDAFFDYMPVTHQSLHVVGTSIFLTNWRSGNLYKVCTISKQLVTAYPTVYSGRDSFLTPAGVLVHPSTGLIFLSEHERQTVSILRYNGAMVDTIGVEGDADSDDADSDDASEAHPANLEIDSEHSKQDNIVETVDEIKFPVEIAEIEPVVDNSEAADPVTEGSQQDNESIHSGNVRLNGPWGMAWIEGEQQPTLAVCQLDGRSIKLFQLCLSSIEL